MEKKWQTYCQNKTLAFFAVKNTTKIAIKILQGSAVTQNTLGELVIYSLFATFLYSVRLPKIVKIVWHMWKLCAKTKCAFFIETPCILLYFIFAAAIFGVVKNDDDDVVDDDDDKLKNLDLETFYVYIGIGPEYDGWII